MGLKKGTSCVFSPALCQYKFGSASVQHLQLLSNRSGVHKFGRRKKKMNGDVISLDDFPHHLDWKLDAQAADDSASCLHGLDPETAEWVISRGRGENTVSGESKVWSSVLR